MTFFNFFFFRGVFISICSVCQVIVTYVLSDCHNISYPTIIVVFAATFIVYNLSVSIQLFKKKFVEDKNIKFSPVPFCDVLLGSVIIVSIVAVVIFLPNLNLKSILLLIVLSFIVLFYFSPIINSKLNLRNLGQIKAIIISIVWVASTCVLPLLNCNYEFGARDIGILISRFIYVYILVMLFDIRDINTDKYYNLHTLAVILGKKYSIIFCELLVCIYLIAVYASDTAYAYKYAMILSSVPLFYAIIKSIRVQYKYFFLFVIDGFLVIQFILILIFKYFY